MLADFDDNRVPVQIVKGNRSRVLATFVHEIRHALAGEKTIVVIYDDASGDEPRPNPFGHLFGGVIHIDIDMAQRELSALNFIAGCVWEDTLQKLDVV
jgi:hypothetical protein